MFFNWNYFRYYLYSCGIISTGDSWLSLVSLSHTPLKMVLSSLFFLDLKGKILISRDYRGDISPKYAEEFTDLLSEREIEMEMGENSEGQVMNGTGSVSNIQPPIFHKDGISYCYIKHNNLYCKISSTLNWLYLLLFVVLALTRRNSNVIAILQFLHRLIQVKREDYNSFNGSRYSRNIFMN